MGAVDHWIPASTSHSLQRCGILSTAPAPQPVLHGAPVVKLITEPLPLLWEQWMAKPQRQGISREQNTFTVNSWSEALEASWSAKEHVKKRNHLAFSVVSKWSTISFSLDIPCFRTTKVQIYQVFARSDTSRCNTLLSIQKVFKVCSNLSTLGIGHEAFNSWYAFIPFDIPWSNGNFENNSRLFQS